MGHKDSVMKHYYSNKKRFADLVNGIYFHGREVIHSENLKDKKQLLTKLEKNPEYKHLDRDSLELLSLLMNAPTIWENRENYIMQSENHIYSEEMEEYNMCQAIRELIEDGKQEGFNQGRIEAITKLLKKGLSKDFILDLDYSEDEIAEAEAVLHQGSFQ